MSKIQHYIFNLKCVQFGQYLLLWHYNQFYWPCSVIHIFFHILAGVIWSKWSWLWKNSTQSLRGFFQWQMLDLQYAHTHTRYIKDNYIIFSVCWIQIVVIYFKFGVHAFVILGNFSDSGSNLPCMTPISAILREITFVFISHLYLA